MTKATEVRVVGPLAPYAKGFYAELSAQGYTPLSAANQMRLAAHLSRWLESRRICLQELMPDTVEQFLRARRRAGYTAWLSERGLAPLLGYLRRVQVVPRSGPPVPTTELDRLLDHYGAYLLRERGLVAATILQRQEVARQFLTSGSDRSLAVCRVTAAVVRQFLLQECRGDRMLTAQGKASNLRSFLRFLHLEGLTPTSLVGAVPRVPGWRNASLPRYLEPRQVRDLLKSCDRRTAIGRRDYSILMLLSRLGLRASEVSGLQLEDIDWQHGELEVTGKGRRTEKLPLPQDVGETLVAYLRRGRSCTTCRHVFLRSRAPHGPLGRPGITAVVYRACERAGMSRVGAHRLRHTAATLMLRQGGSLPEIAQVLRHRNLQTTTIYAKVDRNALRMLALPWPEGSHE